MQTFVNQCKTGAHAELRLFCEEGHLKVTVCADLGRLTAKTGKFSDHWGVPKCSPSRVRRRERRTAERDAVAAAEKVAAEKAAAEDARKVVEKDAEKANTEEVDAKKVSAEKVAERKVAAENVAVEKVDAEKVSAGKVAAAKVTAEKVAAEEAATKKVIAEEIAAEKAASAKDTAQKHAFEASTSRHGSTQVLKVDEGSLRQSCRNCHGTMSADHQCAGSTSQASVVEEQPPPLPLCHYCCHRGSGKDPVHYFLQCVCADWPCTCWCYCTSAQLEHKKLVFPAGFGLPGYKVKTVNAEDRPKARALAEARTGKARPCDNPSCMEDFKEDNARALGQI